MWAEEAQPGLGQLPGVGDTHSGTARQTSQAPRGSCPRARGQQLPDSALRPLESNSQGSGCVRSLPVAQKTSDEGKENRPMDKLSSVQG